ncbi:MAG: tRNA pseudouridine(55) synthase TruB [Bdellovibrio sp. CG10_big_fil_rev_8_21_14_0_10_47_8]|nr:MAG: tRNA pseudouridine(55) synthase TruB [Bdellovibrio sp. CG10_big_fil_rev_8_21_14_0_10_47_8]
MLQTKSVGHSGTLDPMASGLMVLLIGEATKLSQYILEKNKGYQLKAKLGVETDTLDMTGKVLRTEMDLPAPERVKEIASELHGELNLQVPIFSATKVDGKRLYEYARKEQEVALPHKIMTFFDLQWIDQGLDFIELSIRCSKGAYIRAWVDLLGKKLGVGAALSELVRTESMPFHLSQALSLEQLAEQMSILGSDLEKLERGFVPMSAALPEARSVRVQGQDQAMILNGLISHDLRAQLISAYRPGQGDLIKILSQREGEMLALVGLEPGRGFVVKRGFRYGTK